MTAAEAHFPQKTPSPELGTSLQGPSMTQSYPELPLKVVVLSGPATFR